MQPTKTKARVRVVLEIELPDVWGGDCQLRQVWDQAVSGAEGALRGGLVIDGTASGQNAKKTPAKIISVEPVAIIVPREERT